MSNHPARVCALPAETIPSEPAAGGFDEHNFKMERPGVVPHQAQTMKVRNSKRLAPVLINLRLRKPHNYTETCNNDGFEPRISPEMDMEER